jgi:hypothetical protein
MPGKIVCHYIGNNGVYFCLSERPGLVTGKYDVQIMIISAFVALNKSIFSGTSYTVT